jgi:beta-galactosidase
MCNGDSANGTINTCNSCNCVDDGYVAKHATKYPDQPLLWTENEGWFQNWGQVIGVRSPENLAYSVASWIAAGGSYHAYYMYHGGNHYGLNAASSITNMYADDVNLRSDGTTNEPKYSHLGRLHKLAAKHASTLMNQDTIVPMPLQWWNKDHWEQGTQQLSYTYGRGIHEITFIKNSASITAGTLFLNKNFTLAPSSVVIVDASLNVLYNTSHVQDQAISMVPVPVVENLEWSVYQEPTGIIQPIVAGKKVPIIFSKTPREQLNVTEDDTARLWYRANVTTSQSVNLVVNTRRANSLLVFQDGVYKGEWNNADHGDGNVTANFSFASTAGTHLLEILSVSLGLNNGVSADHFERKGVVGAVVLNGKDITGSGWYHQKGLVGEIFSFDSPAGRDLVTWNKDWKAATGKPLVWYEAAFDLHEHIVRNAVTHPVLVNITGLQRGHIYVNGFDIGMYWNLAGQCTGSVPCCSLDQTKCGQPTQLLCK